MSKLSKLPTPDIAEHGAFFPSPFSLSQFTAPVSDLADFNYKKKYDGDKKILIIAADERYLLMDNGTFFSTGNHSRDARTDVSSGAGGLGLRDRDALWKSRKIRVLGDACEGRAAQGLF